MARRGLSEFIKHPIHSIWMWFDSYFRHQSKLFNNLMRLIIFMVACGLVMVLSASNVISIKATGDAFAEFRTQAFFAVAGLAAMLFISRRSVSEIEKFTHLFFWSALVLQLLVRVPGFGVSVGGNTNWINLGFITIQPSEFLKLGVILLLAQLLSRNLDYLWDFASAGKYILIYGFGSVAVVFFTSGDLGTSFVMALFVLGMAALVGLPAKHVAAFAGAGALAVLIAAAISPNRVRRIFAFLDQSMYSPDGLDWQVRHGTWALASGGIFGTGLGESKMKWGWIPEVENDFIFSIIGEEVGLIGAVVVLILFFMLGRFIRQVSLNTSSPFAAIALTGIMLWIVIQALINIAVVLNLFPVLGVPLPLFSKGGSSLVAVLMALGVVLAAEREEPIAVRRVRKR